MSCANFVVLTVHLTKRVFKCHPDEPSRNLRHSQHKGATRAGVRMWKCTSLEMSLTIYAQINVAFLAFLKIIWYCWWQIHSPAETPACRRDPSLVLTAHCILSSIIVKYACSSKCVLWCALCPQRCFTHS